jgi:hypothetical protein
LGLCSYIVPLTKEEILMQTLDSCKLGLLGYTFIKRSFSRVIDLENPAAFTAMIKKLSDDLFNKKIKTASRKMIRVAL